MGGPTPSYVETPHKVRALPLPHSPRVRSRPWGTQHMPSARRGCLESAHSFNPVASVHRPLPPAPAHRPGHLTVSIPPQRPACSASKSTSTCHSLFIAFPTETALSLESRLPCLAFGPSSPLPARALSSGLAHSAHPALGNHPWAWILPQSRMSIFHSRVWPTPSGLLSHVPSAWSGFSGLADLALRPLP